MVRKFILVLILLVGLVLLSGCWDATDINKKDISTLIGIDYKAGDYYFYSEIPDISGQKKAEGDKEDEGSSEFSIVKGQGKDFIDARESLDNKLDKAYFLGTIRAVVFHNNVLKEGMAPYMYRLQSAAEFRNAVKVISSFGSLDELFNVDPENNVSVGYAIEETIDTLSKKGMAVTYTSSQVLEWLYSHNPCYIMPNFEVRDELLAFTGYSVLYDGYYRGFIEFEETNGVIWMLSNNTKIAYNVPYGDNGEAAVEATLKKRKIEPNKDEDGISFKVVLETKSRIRYLNQKARLSKSEIGEVKKNLEALILEDLTFSIRRAGQEFGCEYLGFDDAFRIAYPNDYKELDWSDAFMKSNIEVSVSTELNPNDVIKTDKD